VTGETSRRTIWLDAQLPPSLAPWLCERHRVNCLSLRELGLRDADDVEIFLKAKQQNALLISEDSDFVELVQRFGPPPQLLWLTCGNVTNANLKVLFSVVFEQALELFDGAEAVVEISQPV
jgi:predicted nuclease of predicted toxin-antitoxin system